jgi:hypothetical protein
LIVAVFVLVLVTRVATAPEHLLHFDNVNFALSLEDFNPVRHQPQPPGYPLYVGVLRLLHVVFSDAWHVQLAAGILITTAAAVMLWMLARAMFDEHAALLAIAIFVLTPTSWLSGITNQVRLCLALGSAGVALLAWWATLRADSPARLYATFVALAISAGFRPELGMLLLPIVLWAWFRTGHHLSRLVTGGLLAAAVCVSWIGVSAAESGGLSAFLTLVQTYSRDQLRASSSAFGASSEQAWRTASQSLIWTALAVVSWIWAVPFVLRNRVDTGNALFLTIWLLPSLLFSTFVHATQADQVLASVPALCLIGGAVLSTLFQKPRVVWGAAAGVALSNAVLFFTPPGQIAAEAGYQQVAARDRRIAETFTAIEGAKGREPAAIVDHGGNISWRHISYYFPEDEVLALDSNRDGYSWIIQHRKEKSVSHPAEYLPGPRRIVLVSASLDGATLASTGWQRHAAGVYYRNADRGELVALGPYQLRQP